MKKIFYSISFLFLFSGFSFIFCNNASAEYYQPIGNADLMQVPRYANGPCLGDAPLTCHVDTYAVYTNPDGKEIETTTAKGQYWAFVVNENLQPDGNAPLTTIPRYANGPCAGQTGNNCHIDTYAVFTDTKGHQIETTTANGQYWAFDITNNFASSANGPLTSLPRFASGPCQISGNVCHIKTYTVYTQQETGHQIESITANGQYWAFDITNNFAQVAHGNLASVPRFASGPCSGKTGTSCQFDTYAVYTNPDGTQVETMTANGQYWAFKILPGTPPVSSTSLTLVLGLPGIGYNGPTGVVPKHLTRQVTVQLYDATVAHPSDPGTNPLSSTQGTVTFDSGSDSNAGYFVGTVNISLPASPPANNQYKILVQLPQYLYQLALVSPPPSDSSQANIFTLLPGQSITTAPFSLLPGDVYTANGGLNHLNLDDYTTILGCYGNNLGSGCSVKSSGPGGTNLADLDDNGTVDIVDLNLWLRSISQLIQAQAPGCSTGDCQGD